MRYVVLNIEALLRLDSPAFGCLEANIYFRMYEFSDNLISTKG